MKLRAVLVVCMAVLAGVIPAAVTAWGLWSAPTVALAVVVLCFELMLGLTLAQNSRRHATMTRFGMPLRHNHFPIHHGPLPGVPTAQQGRGGGRRAMQPAGPTTPARPSE